MHTAEAQTESVREPLSILKLPHLNRHAKGRALTADEAALVEQDGLRRTAPEGSLACNQWHKGRLLRVSSAYSMRLDYVNQERAGTFLALKHCVIVSESPKVKGARGILFAVTRAG